MSVFSVIIPNWNGKHLLGPCLDSLLRSDFPHFEVIVVDNGSADGSQQFLKDHYPQIKVIELDHNYGFARACNEGIKVSQADLVCLLNNDVEVDVRWISELKAGMDRHPDCGMGTSKMLFHGQRDLIYNAGDVFSIECKGGGRGLGEKDVGQYENEQFVFGACAGAGVYRKKMFRDIGVFDEDFFIFSEDVDFNLRANYHGYKCIYIPKAKVYHYGTATVGFHSDWHVSLFARNDLFVLIKDYGFKEFIRNIGSIVQARFRLIRETARSGQGLVVFKAWWSFMRHFLSMSKKRMVLRKRIRLSFEHFHYLVQKGS
ncbi:MAG: glycosyltransferase family 2 protein [Candidatus Omnitrophica bacterium]|nr:glycosyltransferase family 2 protein [Candidatus Omnitrophota bacterium]